LLPGTGRGAYSTMEHCGKSSKIKVILIQCK
jgi:hypothetical protein